MAKARRKSTTPTDLAREVMTEVRRQLLASDWERGRARWLSGEMINPSPPAASPSPAKNRTTPQVGLALQVLGELYPDGIPATVSTKTLQAEIEAHLGPKTKKAPGWDSVKTARLLHR